MYKFKCPDNGYNAVSNYIGHITNTLEERMKQHMQLDQNKNL